MRTKLNILLLVLCAGLSAITLTAQTPTLKTDKASYAANESIVVSYTDESGNAQDWIALYAPSASNQDYLAWFYVDGTKVGTVGAKTGAVTFPDGLPLGSYEARFLINNQFTSVSSVAFKVEPPAAPEVTGSFRMWLDGVLTHIVLTPTVVPPPVEPPVVTPPVVVPPVVVVPPPSTGENVTATSCSREAIAAAVAAVHDGGTVTVPAGTCVWTTTLIVEKPITIIGTAVIVDNVPAPSSGAKPPAFIWRTEGTRLTRLSGLTIDGGTGLPDNSSHAGVVAFTGSGSSVRLDHLVFRNLTRTVGLQITGSVLGVVDHVLFNVGPKYGMYVFHDSWQGVGGYGDNSWAQPVVWGSSAFLFVENCQFIAAPGSGILWGNDGWMGQRVVYRHNTYTNVLWANHGTETSGRERSGRAAEIYQNAFILNTAGWSSQLCCLNSVIGLRGGSALVWSNTITTSNGGGARNVFDMANLRSNDPRPVYIFNHCDGKNPWDANTEATGYRCIDQPGAGQGDLLAGDVPTARSLKQRLEPIYAWGNSINGVTSNPVTNGAIPVVSGRDFYTTALPNYTPYADPHPLTVAP